MTSNQSSPPTSTRGCPSRCPAEINIRAIPSSGSSAASTSARTMEALRSSVSPTRSRMVCHASAAERRGAEAISLRRFTLHLLPPTFRQTACCRPQIRRPQFVRIQDGRATAGERLGDDLPDPPPVQSHELDGYLGKVGILREQTELPVPLPEVGEGSLQDRKRGRVVWKRNLDADVGARTKRLVEGVGEVRGGDRDQLGG